MKTLLILFFLSISLLLSADMEDNSKFTEKPILTKSETTYIKNNTFNVITTTTWIPFNFESKNGEVIGIGMEYLKLIAKKVDMDIKVHKAKSFSEVLNSIKNKKYDFNMVTTRTKPKEAYSIFTKSYEKFPIAIAVRSKADFVQKTSILEGKKVAVGKNYSAYTLLKKKYPKINFVQVLNTKEAVDMVNNNEVFAAVDILPVLQQVILNNDFSNSVKIGGITDVYFKLQLMIRDDYTILKDILDKAIDSISVEDRNNIYKGWITGKKVSEFDYILFYELAIVVFIIILVILWWNKKLHNEIDKRIETEKTLEVQKEKFAEILSLLPVPILITEKEKRDIVFANEYSSKQYDIPISDLIGKNIDFIYTEEDQENGIKRAMDKNGYLLNFETIYRLPNGEKIDALLSTIPLVFDDKDCIMGTISDITQIKKVQKELEHQTQIAQAATKARGEFLANMSHEIRTPLNAIVGFIGLLKEEIKDENSVEYLNIVDKSSYSLLGIINDILDFSKIENGKVELEYIGFDPKDEFETLSKLFTAKCKEKNINLVVDIGIDNIWLYSDLLRIKQVVSNLLSNAVKFTSDNKSIKLYASYKNDKLLISVKDEGIGIPKDKLETIFEAFSQAEQSTTRRFGGTGLGLSISFELVRLLGGELKVKSIFNEGSEFFFEIPIKIGKNIKKKNINNNVITIDGNILLVEDNKANQMFMKVILKKLGLKFDIASDGLEAVNMFETNHDKYNCILMDENMPNMNGIEATKKILEFEQINNLTHTPIVALTANALKGDRERFLNAGMDEYLTKPLDKDKLSEVLTILIQS